MLRKIFVTALLCLVMGSVCQAQTAYSTMTSAIVAFHTSSSVYMNRCIYVNIYGVYNGANNSNSSYTTKEYIVWYIYASSGYLYAPYPATYSAEVCIITQQPDGYRYYSTSARTIAAVHPATGAIVNAFYSPPSGNASASVRYFHTFDDVVDWYGNFNDAVMLLPSGVYPSWVFNGFSYGQVTFTLPSLRNPAVLLKDTDGGGVADWLEVFRDPYPGSNVNEWRDDKDCFCGPCCTHKCTCDYRGFPMKPECKGGRNDCDCHKICICGACCSDKCICDAVWSHECDETFNDCSCHEECICTNDPCCSCNCTCGHWKGVICSGHSVSTVNGCSCHVCTCGAYCHHCCICGNYEPKTCDQKPESCVCHQCDCHAGCYHCCTCGKYVPKTCDAQPDSCNRLAEYGGPCHALSKCTCYPVPCCYHQCTCGKFEPKTCPGTPGSCVCHPVGGCTCWPPPCCSCWCRCGKWKGSICDRKPSDVSPYGCDCHKTSSDKCTCGACCACVCRSRGCGKWHGPHCKGEAYDGSPYTCHCHDPVPGNDWFPMDELQESFEFFKARINEKLGFDLVATFQGVKTSSIPDYSFQIPQVIPGSDMKFTSGFTVDVKSEEIFSNFSSVIMMIRSFFLGMIVVVAVMSVMRMLLTF